MREEMHSDVRVELKGIPFDDLPGEATIVLDFPDGSRMHIVLDEFIERFAREEVQVDYTKRVHGYLTETGAAILGRTAGEAFRGETFCHEDEPSQAREYYAELLERSLSSVDATRRGLTAEQWHDERAAW